MCSKNIIRFFIIFFISIYNKKLTAQALNITGDTVFVNQIAEILINFPSPPKTFSTVPGNAPYNLKSMGTGVNVIAKFENSNPATLLVSESGRNHRFIIAFKKDINYSNNSEFFYDYSTEQKIKQHIRETALRKSARPEKVEKTEKTEKTEKIAVVKPQVLEPVVNNANYYTFLEQGEKELKQQNFGAAKANFEKAHQLRPDALIPIQALEEIKKMLVPAIPVERAVLPVNDKDYSGVIASAINFLNQKQYSSARDAYKQALNLRPGDLYSTHQLEVINNLLQEESAQKDQLKFADLYNQYISQGEKAFKNNQLTDATIAYEQALIIRQNDSLATARLKSIGDKERTQKESEDLENNYRITVESADKLYKDGNLNAAKAAYQKATGVIQRAYPQEQIKKIEKLLADRAATESVEKKKREQQLAADRLQKESEDLENNYKIAIESADKLYKDGNLNDARAAYQKAMGVIKKVYPQEQVKTIDKLLADQAVRESNEKKKLEQQLAADRLQKEKQALEDSYDASVQSADKYFKKGDYDSAKIQYSNALLFVKKDWPRDQINEINKIIAAKNVARQNDEIQRKQQQEIDDKYNAAMQSADKLFDAGDYANAKIAYNKANGFVKSPYPQEQVKKIDRILADQILNETNEKQKRIQQLAAERQEKEKQLLEDKYDAAVQTADNYYKKGDYDSAKIAYNNALGFVKKDWPKDQINAINKIIANNAARQNNEKQEKQQQEIQDKYNAAMQSADKFFDAGDYTNAKAAYNKANGFIKSQYPQEQVKKIDKILADQILNENNEKQKRAQQLAAEKQEKEKQALEDKYDAAVQSADGYFKKGDYDNAKTEYNKALLFVKKDWPKEQINEITRILDAKASSENAEREGKLRQETEKTIAALKENSDSVLQPAEITKRYNLAVAKGKTYYQKNDLLNARSFYEEAAKLKPSEEEPKKQLTVITDSLAEKAILDEIDSNYETKIVLADSFLIAKAYEPALNAYKEALSIKALESYPKLQIKFIQAEVIETEKVRQINKRKEDGRIHSAARADAEKAVAEKRYRDAKSAYIEALAIHPNDTYAQDRFKIVSHQLEKTRSDNPNRLPEIIVDETANIKKGKKKAKKNKETEPAKIDSMVTQTNPIPYSNEELKSKYPNIDFSAFPPEQIFNKSMIYSREDPHMYDTMLLEKPRLDSSSIDQGIKLIWQGVNFGETIVYIKLLIQNYSRADFLTGPMLLTLARKTGSPLQLYPYYLYPSTLPVIKPSREAVLIYVCKSYDVLNEETLSFDLTDRYKKIHLQVKMPGSVYNREWAK